MGTGGDGEKAAPALPLEALLALGLDQRTAENALVNSKVTANLAAVIAEVRIAVRSPLVVVSIVDVEFRGLIWILACSGCGICWHNYGCRVGAHFYFVQMHVIYDICFRIRTA